MKITKDKSLRLLLAAVALCIVGVSMARIKPMAYLMKGLSVLKKIEADQIDSIVVGSDSKFIKFYGSDGRMLSSHLATGIDSVVVRWYDWYPALTTSGSNQIAITHNKALEYYEMHTQGQDPYFYLEPFAEDLPADSCVLAFDYQCPQGIGNFRAYFGKPFNEQRSKLLNPLTATIGQEWRTYSCNLKTLREELGWGVKGDVLRLDPGVNDGLELRIRGLHFRAMNAGELAEQAVADSIKLAKEEMAKGINAYLNATYASRIVSVNAGSAFVHIEGEAVGDGPFALVEIPPYVDAVGTKRFSLRQSVDGGKFGVKVARSVNRGGLTYDRALSRWAVVREADVDTDELCSHARYADTVAAVYQAAPMALTGKKGIAAGGGALYYNDITELKAHSITANLVIDACITPLVQTGAGWEKHIYGGKDYYINLGMVAGWDEIIKSAYDRGAQVLAIILVSQGGALKDPENTGGYYTMPNMTTPEAVNLYAASIDYIARRYSTGAHGRINHWIVHNEVDMGTEWTNMGDQPELRYFDRYQKSMRLIYNIVRQYDQQASVLGSYTHNWHLTDSEYSPREMLAQNVLYSKCEGDYRWGVAYHPYPISLTKPKFWSNDTKEATFTKDAKYVTFHNPEVINEWILRPEHRYKDGTKRPLFFSEQGTNSPSYSESDLALQAAGAAWIWKKVQQLPGIDGIQWHNWADNRYEFGLRIGLRAYADGNYTDLQPKPVWYVWQAAGTDSEDAVFAPYLSTLGLQSWDNLIQPVR